MFLKASVRLQFVWREAGKRIGRMPALERPGAKGLIQKAQIFQLQETLSILWNLFLNFLMQIFF
jgi:hypothetical protein